VTGLYYAQARYYEPRVSRIVSPDLWAGVQNNPQSLHKYTYCYNNPLRYVDRDGLSPETVPNPTSFPTPLPTFTPRAGIDAIIWSSSSSQTPTPTSSPSPTLFPAAGIDAVLWGGSTLPSPIRDVTVEINNALQIIITEASERVPTPFQPHPYVSASVSHVQHQRIIIETGVNMMWFYEQVNHRADWDIKREAPWNRTIGTEFPGSFDTQVIYNGKVVTPEYLGNYTYGYIGAALGLPLWMLKGGSWYADGFSLPFGIRGDWANEYGDWYDIAVGFNAYHNNVCEE
jgi:RHS repeat-associated protein